MAGAAELSNPSAEVSTSGEFFVSDNHPGAVTPETVLWNTKIDQKKIIQGVVKKGWKLNYSQK